MFFTCFLHYFCLHLFRARPLFLQSRSLRLPFYSRTNENSHAKAKQECSNVRFCHIGFTFFIYGFHFHFFPRFSMFHICHVFPFTFCTWDVQVSQVSCMKPYTWTLKCESNSKGAKTCGFYILLQFITYIYISISINVLRFIFTCFTCFTCVTRSVKEV